MIRLQKAIADAGFTSRRKAEELIRQGRVFVNDKRADIGDKVSIGDKVYIDGKKINTDADNEIKILIYNKPLGEESTKAFNTKKTVFDNLPKLKIGRWIALGRLDINTTGLLLFCNNGNLADKIIHPRNNLDREYLARIRGKPKRKELDKLLAGIKIEGNLLRFTDIVKGRETTSHTWFAMVIKEGKNRAVRKLWNSLGYEVSRLKRVRLGPIFLPPNLKAGEFRYLENKEFQKLVKDF
ncbi:rRNA pseudouridine synthase [SAR86 cluster bacterium]|nr:rRNA pseudouridine synthase [SAR86 cluster bacterium]